MASSSMPIQVRIHREEAEKTRGTKRSATLLPPVPPAEKKRKIHKTSSNRDTTPLTHEVVLRNIWTPELLRLLGEFLCRRCRRLPFLSPDIPLMWLRNVDKFLSILRAQRRCFICRGTVVFLYMLCRDTVSEEVGCMEELRAVLLTCLYVSYAYTGHEISYSALPFIMEYNRQAFWKRVLDITTRMSHQMLEISISPQFFSQVFSDLMKMKIHKSPSKPGLKNSSATGNISVDASPYQATAALTHKVVLRNVWTPELLRLLGEFLCRRCRRLPFLCPDIPLMWLRNVDKFLSIFRAQRRRFICRGTVVFLYMLCRDTVSEEVGSMEELRAVLLTCLYVSYAYTGHELGFPALPFIMEYNRQAFWKRVMNITTRMSHQMLEISISPQFFSQVFSDLMTRRDR